MYSILSNKNQGLHVVYKLYLNLFWPSMRRNCSSDQEKIGNSKVKTKKLRKMRPLEQSIPTMKGQKNYWKSTKVMRGTYVPMIIWLVTALQTYSMAMGQIKAKYKKMKPEYR